MALKCSVFCPEGLINVNPSGMFSPPVYPKFVRGGYYHPLFIFNITIYTYSISPLSPPVGGGILGGETPYGVSSRGGTPIVWGGLPFVGGSWGGSSGAFF